METMITVPYALLSGIFVSVFAVFVGGFGIGAWFNNRKIRIPLIGGSTIATIGILFLIYFLIIMPANSVAS